ncbi:hypothetical protein SAMN06265379_108107 [Saccharicrinis carchari]|uniref:Uncharacterized protein n=1 Tax=Saccharicrinis carchari TaxID=1168039 RepID=A0A521EBL9_SACCC|nr:hypothetical protein [Saccharicrinis carchari]SMO81313.1 hypothetical protein SAMN06265379_108107 [Saccharicrinis carchari]
MKNNIIHLSRYFYKRYLILVAIAIMYLTSTGTVFAANNPMVQVKQEIKDLKIDKNGRFIKRKYPQTYNAMREFALRTASMSTVQVQEEFDRQVIAFLALEKAWNKSKPGSDMRKAIKIGLLRWNWLKGDPVLNNPRPVDWYMVYMECIVK